MRVRVDPTTLSAASALHPPSSLDALGAEIAGALRAVGAAGGDPLLDAASGTAARAWGASAAAVAAEAEALSRGLGLAADAYAAGEARARHRFAGGGA